MKELFNTIEEWEAQHPNTHHVHIATYADAHSLRIANLQGEPRAIATMMVDAALNYPYLYDVLCEVANILNDETDKKKHEQE